MRVYCSVVRRDRIHFELPDPHVIDALRRMTPAERVAQAHGMWRYARARIEAAVRAHQPELTDEQVLDAVRRRMLGSG